MNEKFERFYDRKVEKINQLKEQLRRDPDNLKVAKAIDEEESQLFHMVIESGKELDKLMQKEKENLYNYKEVDYDEWE